MNICQACGNPARDGDPIVAIRVDWKDDLCWLHLSHTTDQDTILDQPQEDRR